MPASRLRVEAFEGSGHALYAPGTRRIRGDVLDRLSDWILTRDSEAAEDRVGAGSSTGAE